LRPRPEAFREGFAMSPTDLDRYAAACVYPGKLDEQAVERELTKFLQAVGVRRRIVRLKAGVRPGGDPAPDRDIERVLAECGKQNLSARAVFARRAARRLRATLDGHSAAVIVFEARATRAARDARHASDARAADAALAADARSARVRRADEHPL